MKGIKMRLSLCALLLVTVTAMPAAADVAAENRVKDAAANVCFGVTDATMPEVNATAEGWKVICPAVEAIDIVFDAENNPKEIVEEIPATAMDVKLEGKFADKSALSFATEAPTRLQAMVYDKFMLRGLSVGQYSEQLQILPEYDLTVRQDIVADDMRLQSKDELSGLKSEVAAVKNAALHSEFVEGEADVRQNFRLALQNLAYKGSFASVTVPNSRYELGITYDKKEVPDYNNATDVKEMTMEMAAENMTVSLPIWQQNFSNSIKFFIRMATDKAAGNKSFKGGFIISDINAADIAGSPLQRLSYRFELPQVSLELLQKLEKVQNRNAEKAMKTGTLVTDNNDALPILDEMAQKTVLKQRVTADFAEGEAEILLALQKSGNYIVGNGKITLVNFDKIAPDYATTCAAELSRFEYQASARVPEACQKFSVLEPLRAFINMSQRQTDKDGRTVDIIPVVLTKGGIFVAGQNVHKGLEFDMKTLLQNHTEADDGKA